MLSALVLTPLIGLGSGGIQAAADPGLAVPGSTVTHYLQYTADPAGQTADLLWTPPPGGSNFAFSQTPAPGGPPFRFPTVLDQTVITVSYTLPQLPPGVSSWTVAESLAVLPASMEGSAPTAVLYTLISEAAQTAASLDAPSPHHQPTAPGMIDVWRAELWVDILGQPLETATCEEWLAFFQSETTFMALRLPVPPGAPGSIPLPFVYGDANAHTLRLVEYAPGMPTIISGTLSYAPDRSTLLANTLPHAANEYWIALNVEVDSTAPQGDCPPGLNLPADGYGLVSQVLLDLNAFPDNCAGCELELYACYEGQEPPLSTAVLQSAMGLDSYQADGVTYLGPLSLTLTTVAPDLELHSHGLHQHQPGETAAYHHTLIANAPMNVSLSVASNLTTSWGIYEGSDIAPDLGSPITGAIPVNGLMDVWVVGEIPAAAADGAYDLTFTAVGEGPGNHGTAVHLLWVGDWVAPPPPIGDGDGFKLFLPAVVKP